MHQGNSKGEYENAPEWKAGFALRKEKQYSSGQRGLVLLYWELE